MDANPNTTFSFSIRQLMAVTMLVGFLIGITSTMLDTYAYSTSGLFMFPTRTFGRPQPWLFKLYSVIMLSGIVGAIWFSTVKDSVAISAILFGAALLINILALIQKSSFVETLDHALNRANFTIILLLQIVGAGICETVIMRRSNWNYLSTASCAIATVAFWFVANELVMRF